MNIKVLGLWIFMLLLGCAMTASSISQFIRKNDNYEIPVYISQEFILTSNEKYTLSGQLTNLTDEDVHIEKLVFKLTGTKNKTKYYADVIKTDLIVPANRALNIYQDNISYPKGLLKNAYISECYIDGVNYTLKYSSDGVNFFTDSRSPLFAIVFLAGGVIFIIIASAIAITFIIKKCIMKRNKKAQ